MNDGGVRRLSSSLRACPPDETLAVAKRFASRFGISRVTDITRLDRIGLPVYASVRPEAMRGSLCVNAGKGVLPIEAEVGAYMEAIEFALAEPGASDIEIVRASPRDLLGGQRADAVLDLCPVRDAEIDLDEPIACVRAEELVSGEIWLVPAECVFLPYRPHPLERCYFGSNSNGLCSGNSVLEASVHGLCEVIERDVRSFQSLRDDSALVREDTYPDHVAAIAEGVRRAGLTLHVRSMANVFGLPYFMAIVSDPACPDPIFVSGGYGCHLARDIAVTRAVCEAIQSRLSFIHGGRDDLVDRHQRFAGQAPEVRATYARRLVEFVGRREPVIRYDEVACLESAALTLDAAFAALVNCLQPAVQPRVCRVAYTSPDDPLQIVRIIVPGLEFFNETTARIGPRLRDHAHAIFSH